MKLVLTNLRCFSTKSWSDQVKLGSYKINNRFCMAAMTRVRTDRSGIPNDLMVKYYSQRANFGMILTEATAWNKAGQGFPGAGCLFNEKQAEGWKKVVQNVKNKGSKIFIQLFHCGRATHSALTNTQPVAPSAIPIRAKVPVMNVPYEIPSELSLDGIKQTINDFQKSVILAKKAGFDGVQIHGANGYLIDQFLKSHTNKRTDKYGGSIENRCRFLLQLVDITSKYFDKYQIGVKINPTSQYNDIIDSDPINLFSYLTKQLSKKQIGFLQAVQSLPIKIPGTQFHQDPVQQFPNVCNTLKPLFSGLYIANGSLTPTNGLQLIQKGNADMVSFGQLAISNPDLPQRVIKGQPLAPIPSQSVFFAGGQKGYIDFPAYQ